MDEKTLQALTALANKLGTTTEYLWGVLVRQAPLSGAIDLAVIAAWVAGCFWLVRFVRRKTDVADLSSDFEAYIAFAWAGVVTVCCITVLIASLRIGSAVTAIVNPEYWALRQILQ